MENTELLYKPFTKFAIALAVNKGLTLKEAKKTVSNKFEKHPDKKFIQKLINNTVLDKKSLATIAKNCLVVCQDFGPNRDYITLVLIIEEIAAKIKASKDTQNIVRHFQKEIAKINSKIESPPLYNMLLEGRSFIEWSSMAFIYPFIPKHKSNKNRPVLLMPPYLGNDYSTTFVRKYLKSVGYKTYKQ